MGNRNHLGPSRAGSKDRGTHLRLMQEHEQGRVGWVGSFVRETIFTRRQFKREREVVDGRGL